MRKLLMDLGNSIKVLILNGDTVITLEEYDYSPTILDELYATLKVLEIEQLIVITHNVWSNSLYADSCVALELEGDVKTPLCTVSKSDLLKINQLTEKAGINDVKFVDKAGYFVLFGKPNTCYVEASHGMFHLICVKDGIQDFCVSTKASLSRNAQQFCKNNNITKIKNATELYNTDSLMLFTNSALLLDDKFSVSDLSVFAYALIADDIFCYSVDAIHNSADELKDVPANSGMSENSDLVYSQTPTEKKSQKAETHTQIDDLLNDDYSSQIIDTDNLARREFKPEDEIKRGGGYLKFIIIAICFISIGVGSLLYYYTSRSKLESFATNIKTYQEKEDSLQQLNDVYSRCLSASPDSSFVLYNSVKAIIEEYSGTIKEMGFNNENSYLLVQLKCAAGEENKFITEIKSNDLMAEMISETEISSGENEETPIADKLIKIQLKTVSND